jgi:hypothetical protein
VVVVGWPEAAAAQCAMCKTALTNSPEGRDIGEQFNRAILLMIGAPYAVASVVTIALCRDRIRGAWQRFRGAGAVVSVDPSRS